MGGESSGEERKTSDVVALGLAVVALGDTGELGSVVQEEMLSTILARSWGERDEKSKLERRCEEGVACVEGVEGVLVMGEGGEGTLVRTEGDVGADGGGEVDALARKLTQSDKSNTFRLLLVVSR